MRDTLLQALKIRPGEATKVLLMGTYLLLAVATFITGRIARDSLFLSTFDKEHLAYMYISVAVMVPLPAYFYARIADRFRRDRLILSTLGLIVTGMVVCRFLLESKASWVYIVLYNFTEVFGTFLVLQFWTFAGDMFSSREAKRLFPFIGAGAVVASIVCGIGISALVPVVGTENLLFLEIGFLVVGGSLILRLGTMERTRLTEAVVQQQQQAGRRGNKFKVKNQVENVFQSKHLKIIAGMTVATFITVPLIDYQFKVLAKEHFTIAGVVQTDALSSFMGVFTTVTGVFAAVMQFGVTGRVLERFGVVASLLLLPVMLLGGMAGMIAGIGTAFACAVFTKGAENAFRYSIYDATMQVIYTPVPGQMRGRAKTFIDGIVKPLSGGLAGAAMVLIVGPLKLPITYLAFAAAGLTATWIFLIVRIRKEYVTELLNTLRKRRLDFSEKTFVIQDDATVQVLRRTLRSKNPAEVRNAVELARRVVNHDITADVQALLTHDDPDLRVRALEILGKSGSIAASDKIHALFDDDNDEVKAAAVRAFCAIVGEPALRVVKDMLHKHAPPVRGAAVASLIKHGGLEGILLSAEHLKEMQTSSDERTRYAAANVLRDIGVKSFYQPVLALMRDPSVRVQNAAVSAAGAMRSPELIPSLVYKLAQRDTARTAAQALAHYGDAVVDVLGKVLAQEREEPALRRQVPRILERIATSPCLDVLMKNLGVKDPDTRRETARAAARLRDKLNARVDDARVRVLVDEEIRDHYQNLAALEDLQPIAAHEGPNLLRDIGVKSFYQPVLALMRDPSARVQNAAVSAAGAMRSPELIPSLVYKLAQRDTARTAAQALAHYGDAVVDVLGKVLAQEREEPALRRQVPRILERIATSPCLDVLMKNLGVKDPDTRRETARAAARLRDKLNARVDDARVRVLVDEEIRDHYQNLAALEDLQPIASHEGPNLLRDAIEERLARSLDRIFRLLSIIYPLKAIELIHANLKSTQATTRANAIEVLDNLLDSEEKKRVLPLVEDLGRGRVVGRGVELYKLERKAPQEWIAAYLSSRDPWLVVVALHVSGELGLMHLREHAAPHISHPDVVVRETAVRTLAVLTPAQDFVDRVEPLLVHEREGVVRTTIEYLVREARRALPAVATTKELLRESA